MPRGCERPRSLSRPGARACFRVTPPASGTFDGLSMALHGRPSAPWTWLLATLSLVRVRPREPMPRGRLPQLEVAGCRRLADEHDVVLPQAVLCLAQEPVEVEVPSGQAPAMGVEQDRRRDAALPPSDLDPRWARPSWPSHGCGKAPTSRAYGSLTPL